MNKGQLIRSLIAEGHDDGYILSRVPTTLNSVRWHRSKMRNAGSDFRTASHGSGRVHVGTVGDLLRELDLDQFIRDGLARLSLHERDIARAVTALHGWKFLTNDVVTSRLGQCRYRVQEIEVHSMLRDFDADFRYTVLHECAHALCYLVHGTNCGHGPAWQRMMRAFDLPTNAGGVPSRELKAAWQEWEKAHAIEMWVCRGCGAEVPIMGRHKYAPERYTHRSCGGHFSRK